MRSIGPRSPLNRDVALKILPAEVAGDPSRRQRFEIEARAVAALSHPNSSPSTTSARATSSASSSTASRCGAPVRPAEDARDRRPDRQRPGRGARGRRRAPRSEAGEHPADQGRPREDPGLRSGADDAGIWTSRHDNAGPVDGPGVVMGTVGYMSPEQVRGLDADHRSDIFSFGVVLHEMLGGARHFEGETAVDTMQAILREDAPDLPSTVPAGVRQVVSHCLEKDPAHRFQSARDLALPCGRWPRATAPAGQPRRWSPWLRPYRAPARGWRRVWLCSPSPPPPSSPGNSPARQPPHVVRRAAGGAGSRAAPASFAGWPAPGLPGDGERDDAGGRDGS